MELRLALVTRRYWPAADREDRAWRRQVAALSAAGASVTVFTPQWHASWSKRLTIDRADTNRLVPAPNTALRTVRWTCSVTREISKRRRDFDAVIVTDAEEEAASLLTTVSDAPPIIVAITESGEEGTCRRAKKRVFGESMLLTCRRAAAVFAGSEIAAAELRERGFAEDRLFLRPRGIEPSSEALHKLAARSTLGEVNRDLQAEAAAPIVCYGGRWIPERGLRDLLFAWQKAIQVRPEAKLWLVGDGPERDSLYRHVRDLELKYHTAMPGTFESWDELLAASDCFVAPAREEGSFAAILEAASAGTPIVATDIPLHREALADEDSARFVPPGRPEALAEAIVETWLMPAQAAARAARAKRLVCERFGAAKSAEAWLETIRTLIR